MKRLTAGALVLGAWSVLAGCSSGDPTLVYEDLALEADVGAARLNLVVGNRTINSVTAVISAKHGEFATQTHVIDVSGSGVISIFFGNLPVGEKYKIELSAGHCSGSSNFKIDVGQTTLVPVTLTCGDDDDGPKQTGSAQITGTIVGGGTTPSCDHITKMVAAPSIQNGNGPAPGVEVVLDKGVTATSIVWTTSSTTGGSGVFGALSGTTDGSVTFDCSTNGTVHVVADVTALENGVSCTEQARVTVECLNQAGSNPCGNGVLDAGEQCDGTAGVGTCPSGTTGTVTCTPQCTRNTSGCMNVSACGNGALDPGEQCDGTLGVGTCPSGQTGTVTCTPQCTRNTSGCTNVSACGNGVLDPGEQCDGTLGVGTCPSGQTGSVICTPQCTHNTSGCSAGSGPCGECAAQNCGPQRADVNASFLTVDPIIDCVLGVNWEQGNRAAATSCGNFDLLTCYCGTLAGQDCANAAPSALNGQCVQQVLTGTGCTASSCVAPIFLNPANANGKAMQYIQCQQDFCYDVCFNP